MGTECPRMIHQGPILEVLIDCRSECRAWRTPGIRHRWVFQMSDQRSGRDQDVERALIGTSWLQGLI